MMLRLLAAFALTLPLAGCMHEGMGFGEGTMMANVHRHWPTVRIDGLDGARVTMKRGVFGDGLDVRAPFQAEFQPTATQAMAGYPLEIDLDEHTSKRFGSNEPVRLRASLMVPEHMIRHGILRLDVTDCELRALVAGDLDVVKIHSEELPMADVACKPPKREEPHHEACGGSRPSGMSEHMRRWRDKMGWGDGEKGAAVLEIAVMKSGDRVWQ